MEVIQWPGRGGEIRVTRARWTDIPVPSPEMVTASRRHLTERYAVGVDRLLWELEKRTMPDLDAVRAVLSDASADGKVDALDVGAALVTMRAVRLDMDLLEADVLDAAGANGVSAESVAAILELPDAAAARAWHELLASKRRLPRAEAEPARQAPREAAREAAERAGRRVSLAADRAAELNRRNEELRQVSTALTRTSAQASGNPGAVRQGLGRRHAERAEANAGEARVSAHEAAERATLGLLRAADALARCAARCQEWERKALPGEERETLRHRTAEYAKAARSYREMAARYRGSDEGIT